MQKEINKRSEEKQSYENYSDSAKRRLLLFPPDDLRNCLRIIFKIHSEIANHIPVDIQESLSNMRGGKWSTGTRNICLEYNLENCTGNFSHFHRGDKTAKLHICLICLKLYDVGMCHAAHSCPTLSLVDKKIEESHMQINP